MKEKEKETNVNINGLAYHLDVKSFCKFMVDQVLEPNVRYMSTEGIRQAMKDYTDMVAEFCAHRKSYCAKYPKYYKKERARITRTTSLIQKQKKQWSLLTEREELLYRFYGHLLTLDGLSLATFR